ncbi:MAG: indolepyruvate ferredoxin oxidoreductase subunit alpha [Treponema sp.]|jgi:indolepyruvate ferredoxin oxidoreductase alpha subunit|nr:indolepyruvate ferredoxin oxidoreductase subunit alpha [Treponema sp.]
MDGEQLPLLGDEAAALGAMHAGLSGAYGYPGTPSTEILEYLIGAAEKIRAGADAFHASWCSNEKTAMEAALGTSFAGRRALVTMKHVGLNVAADPFINGSLLGIRGGLVVAVADDPGMHSSQNEQDSRFYSAFAMIPCLEPRSQQEAYDMAREAFDVSERFQTPVMLRLVTRLSHARAGVMVRAARPQNPPSKGEDKTRWMLLPVHARRNYASLIERQKDILAWSAAHAANKLELDEPGLQGARDRGFAVITSGLGGNYYEENLEDLVEQRGGRVPARLHIGAYPLPAGSIRKLCEKAETVLVLEEGQPFIEEKLRGLLPPAVTILGRLNDAGGKGPAMAVNRCGELDPDKVRSALALPPRPSMLSAGGLKFPGVSEKNTEALPGRPPQLCTGCPHGDSYAVINRVVAELDSEKGHPKVAVCSDIGCYSLGAAPPWEAIETVVCMGASVGMARGAAEAGIPYAIAVIGDSTFIHSGITGLIDAVAAGSPMTLIILDNSIVAMTGCQPTMVPSDKLRALILGCGVDPAHLLELEAKNQFLEENAARLKAEVVYPGLSVVIFRRECLEALRKQRGREKAGGERPLAAGSQGSEQKDGAKA